MAPTKRRSSNAAAKAIVVDTNSTKVVHSKDTHTQIRESAFSSVVPLDYQGFQNLVLLLLIASNVRLVIENYLKYGLLFTTTHSEGPGFDYMDTLRALGIVSITFMTSMLTLLIEILAVPTKTSRSSDYFVAFQHIVLQTVSYPLVVSLTYLYVDNPMNGTWPCVISTAALLKTVSFILVNQELRARYIENGYKSGDYPKNLTVSNITRFTCLPTLCYQVKYPQTESIRWSFVAKRVGELVLCNVMVFLLFSQYVKPILENFVTAKNDSLLYFVERILKLAVPGVATWLILFYSTFHSYLNLWAELLRFGDRSFYLPWWNAVTIADYWRLWNLPVYNWVKRHVNAPLRNQGYPRWVSLAVVFFISAVAHEVIIGVPLKVGVDFIFTKNSHGTSWAFLGMLMQVPLIIITESIHYIENKSPPSTPVDQKFDPLMKKKSNIGNYLFWISFCIVGQPLIVLLYYRAYYLRQNPQL